MQQLTGGHRRREVAGLPAAFRSLGNLAQAGAMARLVLH